MNNNQRAAAARVALESFVPAVTHGRPLSDFPAETADYAKDLIIDLLHLIRLQTDTSEDAMEGVLTAIQLNYEAEVLEEDA